MPENNRLRYLFVCFAGVNRSPTAVRVAKRMADERGIGLEADFLAIGKLNGQSKTAVRERCESYGRIFVMEQYIQEKLASEYFVNPAKVHCLNIDDDYRVRKETDRILLEAILEGELDKWVR